MKNLITIFATVFLSSTLTAQDKMDTLLFMLENDIDPVTKMFQGSMYYVEPDGKDYFFHNDLVGDVYYMTSGKDKVAMYMMTYDDDVYYDLNEELFEESKQVLKYVEDNCTNNEYILNNNFIEVSDCTIIDADNIYASRDITIVVSKIGKKKK